MKLSTDYLGNEFDTSQLVDLSYVNFSDRNTTKKSSFSRIANFSEIEAGDTILMFQTESDFEKLKEKNPHVSLSALRMGYVCSRTMPPILFEVKKTNHLSHENNDVSIRAKEFGGEMNAYHKQIWRYIG